MINVVLSGANGKMGKVISHLAAEDPDIIIRAGFDINTSDEGGFPVYSIPESYTGECDVLIDFSHPNALEPVLNYAKKRKIPVVIATTGLSEEHVELLRLAADDIPVFFSANMSLGINLLIDLVKRAAAILEDGFDIEIIEKHHNQKIDAPSGTALAIASAISDFCKKNTEYVYDRHSVRRKRGDCEIGIHAVRGGTIVGEHDVIFAGKDEIIEINHKAMSKEIFAVGAIRAAKFIKDQKPGMYNMKSLIG